MCVSTTYFYGPTIQKKLPKSDEKKPKGKRARKNCQWSEKALTKNRYKQQNHKMHRERFKVMRTICNKKITNNTATRKSAYEKLLQVAKSHNVPRKWKILRYSVVQITSDRFGEICKFRSRGSLALLSLGVGIDQWQTS